MQENKVLLNLAIRLYLRETLQLYELRNIERRGGVQFREKLDSNQGGKIQRNKVKFSDACVGNTYPYICSGFRKFRFY